MIVVIATALGGGDESSSGGGLNPAGKVEQAGDAKASTPKSYVVQNGDTLTSIAHETGVPVAIILKLNPGVDPQILISGERLKLK